MCSQCLSCSDIDVNGPDSVFWNNQVHKGLIKWSASYLLQCMKVILFPTSLGGKNRAAKGGETFGEGMGVFPTFGKLLGIWQWVEGSRVKIRSSFISLSSLRRRTHLTNGWPQGDWSLKISHCVDYSPHCLLVFLD